MQYTGRWQSCNAIIIRQPSDTLSSLMVKFGYSKLHCLKKKQPERPKVFQYQHKDQTGPDNYVRLESCENCIHYEGYASYEGYESYEGHKNYKSHKQKRCKVTK